MKKRITRRKETKKKQNAKKIYKGGTSGRWIERSKRR